MPRGRRSIAKRKQGKGRGTGTPSPLQGYRPDSLWSGAPYVSLNAPAEDDKLGTVLLVVLGACVLWLTWPVWVAFAGALVAVSVARRLRRQARSTWRTRLLHGVEVVCYAAAIATGAVLIAHLLVIVYDWFLSDARWPY